MSGSSENQAVPQGKGPGAEGDRQGTALTNQGTVPQHLNSTTVVTVAGFTGSPRESKTTSQTSRKSIWEQQEMVLHMPEVYPGGKATYSLNPKSLCEAQSANHYRRGQDMPRNSSKTQLEIGPELNWGPWSYEGA